MKYQHLDVPKSLLKTTLFFISSKKKSHRKITKKNTENTSLAKTLLKPMKYQHLQPLGWIQGPPQTTKIAPRAPQDTPQTLRENLLCFRFLLAPPQGPPGTPRGPPKDPQGRPKRHQGTTKDPQGLPKDAQGPPRDLRGPPKTP